jgi:hypothetical protein
MSARQASMSSTSSSRSTTWSLASSWPQSSQRSHAREAVDASPDADGIVHGLSEMMTPDASRAPAVARPTALKWPEKARRSVWADPASGDAVYKSGRFAGRERMARPGLDRGHDDF